MINAWKRLASEVLLIPVGVDLVPTCGRCMASLTWHKKNSPREESFDQTR